MFRGLQNFVSDLEASARVPNSQQNSSQNAQASQSGSNPAPAGRGSPGPQSPTGNSNAQLAENALSGLRKSFRSGAQSVRGSIDGYRQSSGDWTRFSQPANSRSSSPAQSLTSPTAKPPAPATSQELRPVAAVQPADEPQPEPAPWPPEPPVLDQEQSKEAETLLQKAADIELPPDPPEAPPKPDLPGRHSPDVQMAQSLRATTAMSAEIGAVLAQYTPFKDALPSAQDLGAWLASQAEQIAKVDTLQAQASTHQSRIEELRDTHKLEVQSLNSELTNMQASTSKHAAEIAAAQQAIKEEEEKRAKSVNLLKAIRQKLTKAEQAREEAEQARQQASNDAIAARSQSEAVVNKLRAGFEREIVSLKGLHEKETASRKSQAELELLTVKSTHKQEVATKDKRIKELEARVSELSSEKDAIFDRNQQMEADLESARSWTSNLEGQVDEKEVQLQDALNQVEALQQDLVKTSHASAQQPSNTESASSSEQQQEALDALERSYKSRISTLESKISSLEAGRSRAEADMSATMESRLNEVERMRLDMRSSQSALEEAQKTVQEWKDRASAAEQQLDTSREKAQGLERLLEDSKLDSSRFTERTEAVREELADAVRRVSELETRLEEAHSKEAHLKSTNKTLRDELRKIQSGLLVSEKARNPGVGYFANLGKDRTAADSATGTPNTSSPDLSSAVSPSLSASASATNASADNLSLNEASVKRGSTDKEAEAINFEYIRNVILQFLEHKDMRPHLVSVLGVILHFTPQELRRVSAKAAS